MSLVPLISAFTDDTSTLSEVRTCRVVKFHKERGASGFVVCGATGDCHLLTSAERKQILEWVVRESQGLPVWAHATHATTASTVDICQHAFRHGARGAIITPPVSAKIFHQEAKAFLTAIVRHGNVQSWFADPEGQWADWSDDLPMPRLEDAPEDLRVLGGASAEQCRVEGGAVSVLTMFGANKMDKIAAQKEMFIPAFAALLRHGGPSRCSRAALEEMGVDVGSGRGPVQDLADEGRQMLKKILAALGGP